jgi:hypothetical protein
MVSCTVKYICLILLLLSLLLIGIKIKKINKNKMSLVRLMRKPVWQGVGREPVVDLQPPGQGGGAGPRPLLPS